MAEQQATKAAALESGDDEDEDEDEDDARCDCMLSGRTRRLEATQSGQRKLITLDV